MQFPKDNSINACTGLEKYLGGEMASVEQFAFDDHLAHCENCRIEVELQRGIEKITNEIVLPKDFSKVVAATAENQVGGLRRRKERTAFLVIVTVLAAILFAVLGANLRALAGVIGFALEQLGAFLNVLASFALNLVLGVVVIVKVAAAQTEFSNVTVLILLAFFLFAFFAYFIFTGRFAGVRAAKR